MLGETPQPLLRRDLTVTIENASTSPYLSGKLTHYLAELGYQATASSTKSEIFSCPQALTSIIAERGNPQDAALLKGDLHNQARIINASLGDIHSSLTLVAGDDLIPLVEAAPERDSRRQRRR